jgi:putative glycosyltransferase (TIGR04372 family)
LRQKINIYPRYPFSILDRLFYKLFPQYRVERDLYTQIRDEDVTSFSHFISPLLHTKNHSEPMSSILKDLRIQKPYVCLVIRDSAYDLLRDPSAYQRQQYRHTPISFFTPAIETLITSGYSVLRMGRFSESPISSDKDRVTDYSYERDLQSDERDVRLFEECSFVLTTVSGPDELGSFFRKNVYRINAAPISHLLERLQFPITLASDYTYVKTGQKVSWNNIVKKNLYKFNADKLLTEFGITISPKSPGIIQKFVNLVCKIEKEGGVSNANLVEAYLRETATIEIKGGIIY